MKARDVSIKGQFTVTASLLVAFSVIIMGIAGYIKVKQGVMNDIEKMARIQCLDWLGVTQLYYNLIIENEQNTEEEAEESADSGSLDEFGLLHDYFEVDFEETRKEELKNLMAKQKLGKTGYLFIMGAEGENEGRYILSKDRRRNGDYVFSQNDPKAELFGRKIIEDALKLKRGNCGIERYSGKAREEYSPRSKILAYTYFKPWNWIIGSLAYEDEFIEDINNARNQIIFICIIAIVLGSAAAYLFASTLAVSVNQLAHKMNEVARGNLNINIADIKALSRKNEIGQLAGAFKQMTDSLLQTTFYKDYVDNIIQNMNDALLIIDEAGRIRKVNNAACKLLGYEEDEILQRPVRYLFMSGVEGLKTIEERIFQGEAMLGLELEFKDCDSNPIPVSFNAAPLKDPEGKIISAILVARDIREHKKFVNELFEARKSLEEKVDKLQKSDKAMLFMVEDLNATSRDLKMARDRLEEKIKEVERSNKELDDFTYVVSHDLKEPLRGIAAFSNFLSDKHRDKLDEQGKHYVDVIQRSVKKMQTLIKELLELSRIGRWKQSREEIDLSQLLKEIKEDLALRLQETKSELKILSLPVVRYERIRISQLFTNLITNAIKYNDKKKPIITVGCDQATDKEFRCYVKDNGQGISKEHCEKVFGLFQRLDTDEDKGTGAGLTICKKIVESHEGRIWIESEVGKGSTFYFTIPKKSGGSAAPRS